MRLWLIFLSSVLFLSGCAGPRQPNSTEALAEQKQRAREQRTKQRERDDEQLRLAVRQLYVNDHPALRADFRKAILKERLKTGMNMWEVIAAYSLWEYTSDVQVARYRDTGVVSLWRLVDRRQTTTAHPRQEEWVLQRQKDVRHLYFSDGMLAAWKG
jgi:hypothetical protein